MNTPNSKLESRVRDTDPRWVVLGLRYDEDPFGIGLPTAMPVLLELTPGFMNET